ncbi:hypothetical protein CDAR_559801 [Caerostris darwini]|uniref:Uncharacterized protein n=1 Tax=Caerostris darwini TaxID=1538125 RepID=A0AAV4TCB3_9ARAC|nr:hypothetical protein CDAR_559801 [Caerostris darwini]
MQSLLSFVPLTECSSCRPVGRLSGAVERVRGADLVAPSRRARPLALRTLQLLHRPLRAHLPSTQCQVSHSYLSVCLIYLYHVMCDHLYFLRKKTRRERTNGIFLFMKKPM